MTYFPKFGVYADDTPSIDAFGRWRVSNPYTVFDSKLIGDYGNLMWTHKTGSAGGTVTYNKTRASELMEVSATSGSAMYCQTRQVINYTPGKSQLVFITGIMSPAAEGIVKRVGYFDENDGLFFEQSGSEYNVVIRNGLDGIVSETRISQSEWNIDKFDGEGPSGITLNLEKAQIWLIDFEWLGVGRVRFGKVFDGIPYYCHEVLNSNNIDSVYMTTPNNHIRWELYNELNLNTGSFERICTSVQSEGGEDPRTIIRSADCGTNNVGITTGEYKLLVGIRLNENYNHTLIKPKSIDVMGGTNSQARWALLFNPTLGGTPGTWQSGSHSGVDFITGSDITITNENLVLESGYISKDNNFTVSDVNFALGLGHSLIDEYDTLILAVEGIAANEDYYGSILYEEYI